MDRARVASISFWAGLPDDELDAVAAAASECEFAEGQAPSVVATTPLRAVTWFKRDVWALEQTAPETARRRRAALDGHRA